MLDQRMGRLGSDLVDAGSALVAVQARLAAIEAASAEARSDLQRIPTRWQAFGIIIASTCLFAILSAAFALPFMIGAEGDMR